ncbi:Rrp15p-domain-containing protein [Gorgonomyces haynaldii]|nr:Rrp15p-domain-containing protein [Gorgonomyces haynaldii]
MPYNSDSEVEDVEEPMEEKVVVEVKPVSAEQRAKKLSSVISKILDTEDTKRPILSKKRNIEAEIDDAKLEAKAKRVLNAEKKLKMNAGHVVPTHANAGYEKMLRKTATKGVVALFNALRAAQKAQAPEKESAPQMAKEEFLKSLKEKPESKVGFLQDDFAMKADNHLEEEEEEELL